MGRSAGTDGLENAGLDAPLVARLRRRWGASFTASMRDLLGQDDLRSRLEAPGAQDQALYPAINGIAPGEGRQLPAPHYFESL